MDLMCGKFMVVYQKCLNYEKVYAQHFAAMISQMSFLGMDGITTVRELMLRTMLKIVSNSAS